MRSCNHPEIPSLFENIKRQNPIVKQHQSKEDTNKIGKINNDQDILNIYTEVKDTQEPRKANDTTPNRNSA